MSQESRGWKIQLYIIEIYAPQNYRIRSQFFKMECYRSIHETLTMAMTTETRQLFDYDLYNVFSLDSHFELKAPNSHSLNLATLLHKQPSYQKRSMVCVSY